MRLLACLLTLASIGCKSSDFVVPALPDARMELDLAVSVSTTPADLACVNTVCGGCSRIVNYDGTPAKEGDPCLWNGTYKCNGTELKCTSNSCLACQDTSKQATGTVCGADGHTIIELLYSGNSCVAYDFGSAIDVCNHSPTDSCSQRCTAPSGGGTAYSCVAHCASDDGGGTGCAHQPSDTCESLTSC